MIKRRAQAATLPDSTCCHTFRATGITTYLEKGRVPRRGKPGCGCGEYRPAPARAPSWSWHQVRIGQAIQRADGRTYRKVGNVQIRGRSLQVTMPQQNLDAAQISRPFQQMGGEAVPQGVGDTGLTSCAAVRACWQMRQTVICGSGRSGRRPGKSQVIGRHLFQ